MNPEHYDNLIKLTQKTINRYRNLCKLVLVVGAIIFLVSAVILAMSLLKASELKETMIPIASTLFGIMTGSFSALPYKEIPPQESKILRYEAIKKEVEKLADLPNDEKMTKIKMIVDLFKE